MQKFSTVVFDLGKVLINFDHNIWISSYNKISSGLGNRYYKKYNENYFVHSNYESGKISDAEFIKYNLDWLENYVSKKDFIKIFSEIFEPQKEVIALLPKLKNKYKLVLLSNTNNIHKIYGWEHYQFLKYFDKLILSFEIGANKPEEKIYKSVENFTKEKPETHIFIDDILEYVEAPKKLGWEGIQFKGYENLTAELKTRNII
ncbi:MAG: haloacid dehalogenase [Ignavibacteriae bacterium]|nr:MAG: haloacid dehalogenase [Ignavibacteriota bacterium]